MWGIVAKVSLLWVVAVLILIISGLVLILPNGKFVVDYISFASSIASLILAVVAIFYSVVSSEGFYTSISEIKGVSKDIEGESLKLSSNSEKLIKISDEIISNLSKIPSSFDELSGRFDGRFDELMSTVSKSGEKLEEGKSEKSGQNHIFPSPPTLGAIITIYLVVIAFENGKKFNISEVFDDTKVIEYVSGYLSCLSTFDIHDVKISYSGKSFEIESIGDLDAEYAKSNVIERAKEGFLQDRVSEINAYFSKIIDNM